MQRFFVQYFIRIIVPVVFLFAGALSPAEQERPFQKTKQQNSVKPAVPIPIDFFSKKKMGLIKELDEVMREMIWLIRSERPSANKTLFGKVYRALLQAKGIKLIEKNKHSCDQYQLEKVSEYQYRVYEHCQKHRKQDILAKMEWSQKKVTFQFQGQNYADVLGVAASLVAPVIDCDVQIESEFKLKELYCTGFRITRADDVIRFQSIDYKKAKDPMMVLKGEVLKNLLPYSDLTISVPLTGRVQIFEKKKVPDADETTAEQKAKEKNAPTSPGAPHDHSLLKNSQPDVIEIQETPQPVQPGAPSPTR